MDVTAEGPPNRTADRITEGSHPGFEVGQRVQSIDKGPNKIGTIKYIGPVQGYQGIWAGVDWDDGDGRHNGTVNGVIYFDADGEKSASFVRLHSLSMGVTFMEALFCRYRGNSTKEEQGMPEFEKKIRTKSCLVRHSVIESYCKCCFHFSIYSTNGRF
jgi:dynactin complex subunit